MQNTTPSNTANISTNLPTATISPLTNPGGTIQQPTPLPSPAGPNHFSEYDYMGILLVIMLVVGAFGGLVNHLLNETTGTGKTTDRSEDSFKFPKWLKSILIGIAASFLVPLFLQTISSQLLVDGNKDILKLTTFAGFCLVAAISSRAFITTLSSKVMQAVEKANENSEQAKVTATAAKESADNAQGKAESARKVAIFAAPPDNPVLPAGNNEKSVAEATQATEEKEKELIERYNSTRSTLKASDARTAAMAGIFRNMTDIATSLEISSISNYLMELDNKGKRLLGYAYLFSSPKLEYLNELVDSVINVESTPFGQYWGILTIGRTISAFGPGAINAAIRQKLANFLDTKLEKGTDRWNELRSILAQF